MTDRERLAEVEGRQAEFYALGDELPRGAKRRFVGEDVPWLIAELREAWRLRGVVYEDLRELNERWFELSEQARRSRMQGALGLVTDPDAWAASGLSCGEQR